MGGGPKARSEAEGEKGRSGARRTTARRMTGADVRSPWRAALPEDDETAHLITLFMICTEAWLCTEVRLNYDSRFIVVFGAL